MPRLIFAAALLLLALAGCAPVSVTFTFGGADAPLRETVVMESGADGKGDAGADGGTTVALIDIRGMIADAQRPGFPLGSGGNPVDEFVARLNKAEWDASVKAIVVRINSPGGAVTASDTMYRELRRFAEVTRKPVVASLADVAASGGYYLALGADEIVAQPSTITGSVGVIIPTINVSEGLGRIGIVSRSVKSGRNKDIGNPLEPMREHQYEVLQGLVDEFYTSFRGLVIERREGRGLDLALIEELTDGRVVSGSRAVDVGLADHEGGLREAFGRALELAGAKSGRLVKYSPESEPRPRTAYAHADGMEAGARGGVGTETEINLLQLHVGSDYAGGAGGAGGPNAYYLWIGP
ncbi:MAG: signal peptide peptidase SppA [Phycisphaerales bacterium]|nr:signal peptide peptidase SppA [Phycisphaerales bacterium]